MDTLPDLRVTIAEGMEALAWSHHTPALRDREQFHRLMRGADTLRWCADREAPTIGELQAEIERLEDVVDAVDAAINEPGATMARRMQAIREAVA